MLRPRIVPCLLIRKGGLVKTIKFEKSKYIGDPLNAVRIFNEKEVDELIVVDIDATSKNLKPDYDMIKRLATECRMPLCYGGGVKTVEQIQRIISLGVEKVAISSAAVNNPELIFNAANKVGKQSVVVVMDIRKTRSIQNYEMFTHNGKKSTGLNPMKFAQKVEFLGAGEIVVNSIDSDGAMNGYDFDLVRLMHKTITLPITILGGAGSLMDISELIKKFGIIGASAGSLFVFKGKYRAVLINYPNRCQKDALIGACVQRIESEA